MSLAGRGRDGIGSGGQALVADIPPWQTEQRFGEIFGGLSSKITSLNLACGREEEAEGNFVLVIMVMKTLQHKISVVQRKAWTEVF